MAKAREGATPRPGLAEARKRAGHTQATLAERIGISKHTISQWETGNNTPSPRHRLKLAPALSVSLEELDRLIKGDRLTSAGVLSDGVLLERLVRADPERARRVLAALADAGGLFFLTHSDPIVLPDFPPSYDAP
jgi:transcriptional regulator with XRE-family HTH domain